MSRFTKTLLFVIVFGSMLLAACAPGATPTSATLEDKHQIYSAAQIEACENDEVSDLSDGTKCADVRAWVKAIKEAGIEGVSVSCEVTTTGCFIMGTRQRTNEYESTLRWIVQVPCDWLNGEEVGVQPSLKELFGDKAERVARILGVDVDFELVNDGMRAAYKDGKYYITDQDWEHEKAGAYNSVSCLVPSGNSFDYYVNDLGPHGEWSFGTDVCDGNKKTMAGPYTEAEVLDKYSGDIKGSYELGALIDSLNNVLDNEDVTEAVVIGIWDVNGKPFDLP